MNGCIEVWKRQRMDCHKSAKLFFAMTNKKPPQGLGANRINGTIPPKYGDTINIIDLTNYVNYNINSFFLAIKGFDILNKNETFADCGVHKRSGT